MYKSNNKVFYKYSFFHLVKKINMFQNIFYSKFFQRNIKISKIKKNKNITNDLSIQFPFKNKTISFWKNFENHKLFFNYLSKKYNIEKWLDWRKINKGIILKESGLNIY